jgi:hypothetical protein
MPPRSYPSLVQDGLIAALLHRPVWSLRLGSYLADGEIVRGHAVAVLDALSARGIRPLLLGDSADRPPPSLLSKRAEVVPDRGFPQLLVSLDLRAADLAHVGPSFAQDVEAAMQAGLRVIWVHPSGPASGRGVLRVESLCELLDLLVSGGSAARSSSTYHEI